MKMRIILRLSIWLIMFLALVSTSLKMISAPNTIENCVGFLILVMGVAVSIKTEGLTKIKLQKKDEK